ncbi:hypothetical protein G6677_03890 [Polynucleobacter paneuropaeus]|nr:hypothetical protein [Polynucleobacter paneuropaeus]
MTQSIYVDAVTNISIINSSARLDLATYSLQTEGTNQVKLNPAGTLVISLDGFVKLHTQLDGVVKKMIEDGLLKQAVNKVVAKD